MSQLAPRKAFVLAGPTATGKSDLAHRIAREQGWPILSADAMLVYRGMDIGTAKPTPAERAGLRYGGMDCVTPDQPFSVGAWLDHVRAYLDTLHPEEPILVVGGTGLYIKSLLQGLDPMPPVDPELRAEVEALHEREGMEGLRKACAATDPARYDKLKDKSNPRRLMRALELARMGVPIPKKWEHAPVGSIVVLQRQREKLNERIAQRVDRMYEGGLLDEVRSLLEQFAVWSDTASMAIGYQEALAVLDGKMDEATAKAETIRRTRRLGGKQLTWFRHQFESNECAADGADEGPVLARRIMNIWNEHGPIAIAC